MRADVRSRRGVSHLKPGDRAVVTLLAYRHTPLEGVVERLSRSIYVGPVAGRCQRIPCHPIAKIW